MRRSGWRLLQAVAEFQALVNVRAAAEWRALAASGCRLDTNVTTLALIEPVELAAADPDHPAFACATAALLADVLKGGRAPESIAQNWQAWHEIYAAQDVRARATLTMGFVQLADLWPLDPAPDLADAAMTDGPAIRTELIALAREMPDTVLYHVAHADYGYLAEQHLTALRDVLARPETWRTRDGTTDEVIGLISHVPGQTGFAGCTALMLIDTTNYGDRYGDMDFRWANNAATYLDMPPPTGAPVLAGFRLLYETDEDWNPYGVSE